MSTPAVPSSRGRLALALTAAAAAAAPGAASAAPPVAMVRSDRGSLVVAPHLLAAAAPDDAAAIPGLDASAGADQLAASVGATITVQFSAPPASASLFLAAPSAGAGERIVGEAISPTAFRFGLPDWASGEVLASFRTSYAAGAAERSASFPVQLSIPEAPAPTPAEPAAAEPVAFAPTAGLELAKLTGTNARSARLAFDASHDGFLRVKWSAGGRSGTLSRHVLAGYQDLALPLPGDATHVRLRASLLPTDDTSAVTVTGSFRLRRSLASRASPLRLPESTPRP